MTKGGRGWMSEYLSRSGPRRAIVPCTRRPPNDDGAECVSNVKYASSVSKNGSRARTLAHYAVLFCEYAQYLAFPKVSLKKFFTKLLRLFLYLYLFK